MNDVATLERIEREAWRQLAEATPPDFAKGSGSRANRSASPVHEASRIGFQFNWLSGAGLCPTIRRRSDGRSAFAKPVNEIIVQASGRPPARLLRASGRASSIGSLERNFPREWEPARPAVPGIRRLRQRARRGARRARSPSTAVHERRLEASAGQAGVAVSSRRRAGRRLPAPRATLLARRSARPSRRLARRPCARAGWIEAAHRAGARTCERNSRAAARLSLRRAHI